MNFINFKMNCGALKWKKKKWNAKMKIMWALKWKENKNEI